MIWNGNKIGQITFLTTWLLFCYNVNNMAVKTDNSWQGKERLRDFWRGCVSLHTPGSHHWSLSNISDWLRDGQGKAIIQTASTSLDTRNVITKRSKIPLTMATQMIFLKVKIENIDVPLAIENWINLRGLLPESGQCYLIDTVYYWVS